MAIKQKKGLGLLGKVIVFSLVPAYFIVGMTIYIYNRGLKEGITQKYIEEGLWAASAIQSTIQSADLIERPSLMIPFLKEVTQINPNFLKINIYATVDGKVKTVASTDPEEIGQTADPKDAEPLFSGKPVLEERLQGGLRLLETIAPYLENGRPVGPSGSTPLPPIGMR